MRIEQLQQSEGPIVLHLLHPLVILWVWGQRVTVKVLGYYLDITISTGKVFVASKQWRWQPRTNEYYSASPASDAPHCRTYAADQVHA